MPEKLDPSKITIENGKVFYKDFDFFCWPYEGQTKTKHNIFKDYFNAWVRILTTYYNTTYIDCFGGCGGYIDLKTKEFHCGSPILAAEIIKEKSNLDVRLVIIEQNIENIENLKKIFSYKKINTEIHYIQGDFDDKVNRIIDNNKNILGPTFFMIDPFGFSIKYETLKRIMTVEKSEILLNFMFNSIQRFLKASNVASNMIELFGCEDFQCINSIRNKKEQDIIDLYRSQLKKFVKFVCQLSLPFPNKKQTYYYLFHLTNHRLGCDIMKGCFLKYKDKGVQGDLFDDCKEIYANDYTTNRCAHFLLENYPNGNKKVQDILEEKLDERDFQERHFKEAIKCLKDHNKISITQIPAITKTGKPKRKIDYTDIIHFS